jgi:hypothetical protein
MLKKLKIPAGKVLKSLAGNYVYKGPCVINLHRGLKIPDTYEDGTPIFPEKEDTVEKKEEVTEEVTDEVTEEVTEELKQEKEVSSEDTPHLEEQTLEETPKKSKKPKRSYKKKSKIEEVSYEPVDENVSPETTKRASQESEDS